MRRSRNVLGASSGSPNLTLQIRQSSKFESWRTKMKLHPLLLIIIACGGGDSANAVGSDGGTGGGGDAGGVAITVEPQRAYVAPGGSQSFKCNVAGASDASCTWSVVGGAANGAITSAGVYTAPSTLGISQVIAASKAVPAATASAIVVVQSAATGKPGVWTNVTPRAVNLDNSAFNNSNFGVQDVIVDPVRPTDVYAFICFQGVWKSTDYGATWTGPINTGAGGALVSAGKPWTAAIDPSPRDPATPPTLWTAAGDAAVGVLKSTDGGVSWTAHLTKNTTAAAASGDNYYANDAYALDVDPNDGKHLVTGFHQYPGISESFDGGVTWTTISVPSNIGNSLYPFFIDSGAAATTRKNWLAVSQDGDNTGTWHTKDGGASWTQVGTFSHGHGDSQMWNVGSGVMTVSLSTYQ